MKINALPKLVFNDLMEQNNIDFTGINAEQEHSDTMFISINETENMLHAIPRLNKNGSYFIEEKSNVLILHFDDVSEDLMHPEHGLIKAMDEGQAERVIKFLEANKGAKKLLVHCAAGVSRSGAVAQFVNDYYGGDKEYFKRNNKYILPNPHVFALLKKKHYEIVQQTEIEKTQENAKRKVREFIKYGSLVMYATCNYFYMRLTGNPAPFQYKDKTEYEMTEYI